MKAKANLKKPDGYANDTERNYALLLEMRKRAGEILDWKYAAVRLRLADGAWYKPDFQVINTDGVIEYHEVKGFWQEAAKVRIKVANEQHPYTFVAVYAAKGGKWRTEVI